MIECGLYKPVNGFTCTGSDESHIWNELHKNLIDKFHCGTCQKHADKLFNGLHSMVSLGIGKKLVKPEYVYAFNNFVEEVNAVNEQALKDGRI